MWYVALLILVSVLLVLFALSEKTYNFALNALAVLAKVCFASMALAVLLYAVGAAAKADELRSVKVIDFDFAQAEVVVEDEDGYIWAFELGEHSWFLEQEFYMVLPDDGEPYLIWEQEGGVEPEV